MVDKQEVDNVFEGGLVGSSVVDMTIATVDEVEGGDWQGSVGVRGGTSARIDRRQRTLR